MVGPVGSSSTIPATCSPSASFEIFEMVIARGRRERERDLYIYIYIYIHICLCMCVYIYICTYISCITYGQIWSYMVLYINLQMIHVLSLDSCNFTDMTRPCAKGLLPQLRRAGGRVLHLGTSVAHHPQKGTAT